MQGVFGIALFLLGLFFAALFPFVGAPVCGFIAFKSKPSRFQKLFLLKTALYALLVFLLLAVFFLQQGTDFQARMQFENSTFKVFLIVPLVQPAITFAASRLNQGKKLRIKILQIAEILPVALIAIGLFSAFIFGFPNTD